VFKRARTNQRLASHGAALGPEVQMIRLPSCILAAIDVDCSDPSTIQYAAGRAREALAHLTVMCVWRPTWFLGFTALAGDNPAELRERHEREAAARFHGCLKEVPDDLCVRALFLEGRLAPHVIRELRRKHYDELILCHRLRARDVARLRRTDPHLKVVLP
jgi:hypothetical protein